MSAAFPVYQNLAEPVPLTTNETLISELAIAPCENCARMQTVKRELSRIRRELLSLADRLDKTILSQD